MNYIRIYNDERFLWTNDGEDYPNVSYFKELINDPRLYTEFSTKDVTVDWKNDFSAHITIALNKIVPYPRYIGVYVEGKIERYYTATTIYLETNTTTTYSLTLDTWGTFCIPLLTNFIAYGIPLSTTRNHILNPRAYQLNDTLLNSIPLTYDRKNNISQPFPYTTTPTQIINPLPRSTTAGDRQIFTDKNSLLNGNIYYVFNGDGKTDTTNYYFVPVLAKDAGAVKYSYKKLASTLMQSLEPSIDTYDPIATQSTYEGLVRSGLIAKYMRNYMSADTQPREVSVDYNTGCYPVGDHLNPATMRETTQLVYKNGEQVVNNPYISTSPFVCPPNIEPYKLNWGFYLQTLEPTTFTKTLKNTSPQVKDLLKNTDLINKFKGVFFMPNFINFSNDLIIGDTTTPFADMLYLKIDATGIPLNISLPWFNTVNAIPVEWNSTTIENLQVKSFENYSYYQNTKNWADYTDTIDLNLSGLFIFNGAGSFFPTSSRLKSVDAVINYPYQLPSATDGYIEYYSRNLSSVNNGINQQKIQYDLSKDRLIGGAVFGAAGIASNAKPDISTALSAGSFAFNTAMSARDLERQNQSYYKGLAAQYEDVQRNTGANFNTSNVNDSTNIIVQLNTPYHTEIMEKMDLNVETIKVLNNVLFLYGNLNIGVYPWSELTGQHVNFNYVKLNEIDLFSQLSVYANSAHIKIPRNYIRMTINFLSKGYRVHNNENCISYRGAWFPNPLKTSLLRDANGKDSK